ncbi:PilN domain-containing protein [Coralloluteibacterium stylophorae]|uniref:PilN domain-containing protein n=1 Tax=Coralloluteibacterium stylophorae TaxID=1776034 RepID=A0A8J8AZW1_9GAMM|nr:PilN domain-containing protein [Coralloluteibacterium stylophorae]MBS7458395.1 PilN domain-containing protein [Coralloluteibacterium stylophorae]
MARINLLPWRAERRKRRQNQYMAILGATFAASLLAGFLLVSVYNGRIEAREERIAYLQNEISQLDVQIKEIETLDRQKARLLARKQVIEDLQANRSQMVHLFDQLVRTIPDGVQLTSIKQAGTDLTLQGSSQSNARVSAYMRNLESSGWMTAPDLQVIEAKEGNPALPYEFTLQVKITSPQKKAEAAGLAAGETVDATAPAGDAQ